MSIRNRERHGRIATNTVAILVISNINASTSNALNFNLVKRMRHACLPHRNGKTLRVDEVRDNDFSVEVRENNPVLIVSELCKVEQLSTELCIVYKLAKKLVVDDRCGDIYVISLTSKDVCNLGVTEEAVDAVIDVFYFNSSFLIFLMYVMTTYTAFFNSSCVFII